MEHCAPHKRAVHAATAIILIERRMDERTGSSSLNCFQVVFTRVVVESSQPPTAESMSLSSKRKLPPPACQVRLRLPFVVQGTCCAPAPCTSVIRVLCQTLEPTAYLVHPLLAGVAEDAVAVHSSATNGTWKLASTLQEVQACTTDHDLCLSCIYSLSFLLHCFFPSQEPPDTLLKRFSDNNKVIGIEVLLGDPRAELMWQGFKHNDEEQGAEYRALVNTLKSNTLKSSYDLSAVVYMDS